MFSTACRSFSRVDRVYKLANSYVQSNPIIFNKGSNGYHGVSFDRIGMDWNKKQKTVWKPVSTQAITSSEGGAGKDIGVATDNPQTNVICKEKSNARVISKSIKLPYSKESTTGEVGSDSFCKCRGGRCSSCQ
ncbi:hypothetical protein MKW94_013213 [Papaver nudicaule]|uniref:Uncharacterized protein n=1 Tax=Papaver nudicaule TaxID=74823 RepID=A0AA41SCW5_PAPNU|nr:hypothetical protein [Papaver nudicaule]